jgi:hypothetical protein
MAVKEEIAQDANGERNAGLTRIYGAARRDEPPAHLDAAILAAARREAGARPRRLWAPRAWRVPVGLAAVVVLSVSLVTLVREEGGDELYRPVRPDLTRPAGPAPQPSQDAAKSSAAAEPAVAPGAPRVAPGRAAETQDSRRDAPSRRARGTAGGRATEALSQPHPQPFQGAAESPAERTAAPPPADDPARAGAAAPDRGPPPAAVMDRSPAAVMSTPAPEAPAGTAAEARRPVPPAAKAAPPRAMRSERDMPAREDASQAASGAAAAAPQSEAKQASEGVLSRQQALGAQAHPPRVAAILKELDAQPPEKWLERIQALRREGQTTEAREVLAEFKRRYPAYPLPAELQ